MKHGKDDVVPNEERGESLVTLGDLSFVVSPTFGRVSRTEQALGASFFDIAVSLGNEKGLRLLEMAIFFEQLSRPRVKRDEIGERLARPGGYREGLVEMGKILDRYLSGDDDGDDAGQSNADADYRLPGENDSGEDEG